MSALAHTRLSVRPSRSPIGGSAFNEFAPDEFLERGPGHRARVRVAIVSVLALPSAGHEEETALIDALERADPHAMAALYRAHQAKVRAFATRMLDDRSAAEDVVHDAFVALPRALSRFRKDAKLETFLMSIAVNLCRRRARSAARAVRAVARAERRQPVAIVPTPEADVRRQRLAAALARALETLSVEHREVFVLCALEERSSQEVAEIARVPEGTVRSRLFHARKQLRAFLEREGVE